MMADLDRSTLDRNRLVELAQKGSSRAIARLFKHELHPRRIAVVKTRHTQGTFRLLIESVDGVAPDPIFQLLRRVLFNTKIKSVKRLKVYARRIGSEQVDWIRVLDLRVQNQLQLIELPQTLEAVNFLNKVEFPARPTAP